jgi:hypothetical protein
MRKKFILTYETAVVVVVNGENEEAMQATAKDCAYSILENGDVDFELSKIVITEPNEYDLPEEDDN